VDLNYSCTKINKKQQFMLQKIYIEGGILRYIHQLQDVERFRYIGLIFPSKKISELKKALSYDVVGLMYGLSKAA